MYNFKRKISLLPNNYISFLTLFILAIFLISVEFLQLHSNRIMINDENCNNITKALDNNVVFNDEDCSIEECINFKMCNINQKLSIFIFDYNKINELDLKQSIDIISNENKINESCLVVIFLKDIKNDDYYQRLCEFLTKYDFNQINNLILIDISNQYETSTKRLFINYLMNTKHVLKLSQDERQILSSNLIRSMFSSYSYLKSNYYENLFIHFSILNDDTYFTQIKNLEDFILNNQKLYSKRKYLISYHQAFSEYNNHKLEMIQGMLSFYTRFHFNIDYTCSTDSISNNLCFDVENRVSILMDSYYTLIIPDKNIYFWSHILTYRLIEALKCSTIPVLIDANLKLPLDDFIAWDEIVIRMPFSRINNLVPILSSIDQNDLANRQIKARNVFRNYFSSKNNQVCNKYFNLIIIII
jgi:hypothetical protein